jgi:hypothetical protein
MESHLYENYKTKLMPFLSLLAFPAYASVLQVRANVVYAGTYANGDVFIGLSAVVDEPGCPADRLDIPASHPQLKQYLAIAQIAMTSGKTIMVKTLGCFANSPSFDNSRNSYFFIDDR